MTLRKQTMLRAIVMVVVLPFQVKADFVVGPPENLGPINTPGGEAGSVMSTDGLTLYLFGTGLDIKVSHRDSTEASWGPAVSLPAPINTAAHEASPSLSPDGLTLYFSDGVFHDIRPRVGGEGGGDIWVSTRQTTDSPWREPENLGAVVNTPYFEGGPCISSDGLSLLFGSDRPGGSGSFDVWVTTRPSQDASWTPPVNLGPEVNSSFTDVMPSISADGLILFFQSNRSGRDDLWFCRRHHASEPFGPALPFAVDPIFPASQADVMPDLAMGGAVLTFSSFNRVGGEGGWDLWQVAIDPIIDFDGNERVDIGDLLRLIDSWGSNDPAVDVGPTPFGDGIVDAHDLEVLMGHWHQEVPAIGLIAHWELDEAQGDVAYDRRGGHDAVVLGDAAWMPEEGYLNGALRLDGNDDYIEAPYVLNPGDSIFSIFAWVKGGKSGQVIMSQADGADWLELDAHGRLSTALKSNRRQPDLFSEAAVFDDRWHRIGLTWDGLDRVLYLDDHEVARDSQGRLEGSRGALLVGAGSDLASVSFWSGFIDDVRIYERVIVP